MKRLIKIIQLFCLTILSSAFMTSLANAKNAEGSSTDLKSVFKLQPESFDQTLGQWNAVLLNQKIQLNILEFSQKNMKGNINIQGETIPIHSKVSISKIAHEYKFSFKLNRGKFRGRYILFVNTQQPKIIHGYYQQPDSKEFALIFKH